MVRFRPNLDQHLHAGLCEEFAWTPPPAHLRDGIVSAVLTKCIRNLSHGTNQVVTTLSCN